MDEQLSAITEENCTKRGPKEYDPVQINLFQLEEKTSTCTKKFSPTGIEPGLEFQQEVCL